MGGWVRRGLGGWRGVGAHVFHQALELVFGAVGCEIGDLGLERACQIGCGVDDGGAEVVDLVGVATHGVREAGRFRVQAHTQHRIVLRSSPTQHVSESHNPNFSWRANFLNWGVDISFFFKLRDELFDGAFFESLRFEMTI